mmetsp:Transcript_32202/g.94109  ORF Transcript_32202/g.94109 Transcript_32202/m.94109 type:complete len:208 (-) Transcript_32202:166-789(-)
MAVLRAMPPTPCCARPHAWRRPRRRRRLSGRRSIGRSGGRRPNREFRRGGGSAELRACLGECAFGAGGPPAKSARQRRRFRCRGLRGRLRVAVVGRAVGFREAPGACRAAAQPLLRRGDHSGVVGGRNCFAPEGRRREPSGRRERRLCTSRRRRQVHIARRGSPAAWHCPRRAREGLVACRGRRGGWLLPEHVGRQQPQRAADPRRV